MPSVSALLLKAQLKLVKPLIMNLGVESIRKGQDAIGALGAKAYGVGSVIEPVPFEWFEARMITPKDCRDDGAVLYLHGGAYVAGGIDYAQGYGSLLARDTGLRVLCVAYRLAPEHPFPAALDDAFEAYEYLQKLTGRIVLAGESAGGGLLLALTYKLITEGAALPLGDVAISPWTDLTQSSNTYQLNRRRDPTLGMRSLAGSARMYAGADRANPFVSPLFCDVTGFPPCLLLAGSDELLVGDSRMFHKKLVEAGVPVTYIEAEGMWHGYPLYAVPESDEANKIISDFILERINGKED